jgi:hypothetical protein
VGHRGKGRALRRRYGRSHTAARHIAEEALRVAYDNPTPRSLGLVERLYEQASSRANVEGHTVDAQNMWRRHEDVAAITPYAVGNESADEARLRARAAIHTIMEKS